MLRHPICQGMDGGRWNGHPPAQMHRAYMTIAGSECVARIEHREEQRIRHWTVHRPEDLERCEQIADDLAAGVAATVGATPAARVRSHG